LVEQYKPIAEARSQRQIMQHNDKRRTGSRSLLPGYLHRLQLADRIECCDWLIHKQHWGFYRAGSA
jgi:hypothetical protein